MDKKELSPKSTAPHQGRNVKRFREMWGMKQEALATELGMDWTQKKVSQIESMEVIEQTLLDSLAKVLRVTPEAIQNFDEEKTFAIISNTFNDNCAPQFGENNNYPASNNNEEILLELKKVHESLLKEKDERIALLQKLLDIQSPKL